MSITGQETIEEMLYIRNSMFPNLTLEELLARSEVINMSFDALAAAAMKLETESQSKMLFYLLGNLNGFYKYDFENSKALSKQQAISLVNDSLQAVI